MITGPESSIPHSSTAVCLIVCFFLLLPSFFPLLLPSPARWRLIPPASFPLLPWLLLVASALHCSLALIPPIIPPASFPLIPWLLLVASALRCSLALIPPIIPPFRLRCSLALNSRSSLIPPFCSFGSSFLLLLYGA